MNRDPHVRRGDRDYDRDFDRIRKPPRDDARDDARDDGRIMDEPYERGAAVSEYRTLCISNLNPRVPDQIVSQALYEEFAKFGDFNVKVVHQGDHRIAYVNFKFSADAREAKHSRRPGSFILFDMPVRVDSVIHQKRPNEGYSRDSYPGRGGLSPGQGRRGYRDEGNYGPDEKYDQYSGGRGGDHKFPHHLNHIAPEEDSWSTRTLFVGNLDNNISEEELRSVFSNFGIVEEIDIKHPAKQGFVGNAYAFLKFINLDMAHRAKVEMSGKYIGKYQCKIGYGKVSATNVVWIGGLGLWVTLETIEQEFDRFGAIKHIEWQQGKNYGYVVYDNADAAQAAASEMRGFPLGGKEHRLRVDFADESHLGKDFGPPVPMPTLPQYDRDGPSGYPEGRDGNDWRGGQDRNRRESHNSGGRQEYRDDRPRNSDDRWSGHDRNIKSNVPNETAPDEFQGNNNGSSSFSPPSKRRKSSPCNSQEGADRGILELGNAGHVESVQDLAKCLPVVWNGALVLKNSAFAARMHLVSGDVRIVDNLMRDPTTNEMQVLKITQRLRLDPPKLEEVGRRVSTSGAGGQAVLLAMPGSSEALEEASNSFQHRPLKNLVSYLKQKDAAGVISLPPNPGKDKDNVGVLHSFPPCQFGHDFLVKRAAKIQMEPSGKEEHLVIVVVKGAALT